MSSQGSVQVTRGALNALQQRPHRCSECERSFKRRSDLKRHTGVIHGNGERFPCPVEKCSRHANPYTRRYHLKDHCLQKHNFQIPEGDITLIPASDVVSRQNNLPRSRRSEVGGVNLSVDDGTRTGTALNTSFQSDVLATANHSMGDDFRNEWDNYVDQGQFYYYGAPIDPLLILSHDQHSRGGIGNGLNGDERGILMTPSADANLPVLRDDRHNTAMGPVSLTQSHHSDSLGETGVTSLPCGSLCPDAIANHSAANISGGEFLHNQTQAESQINQEHVHPFAPVRVDYAAVESTLLRKQQNLAILQRQMDIEHMEMMTLIGIRQQMLSRR